MDHWFWYDAATQSFPLQKDHLLDLLNHRLAKYIAIALGAVALLYGAYKRNAGLVTAALLMGLGALVVGVLKALATTAARGIWWSMAGRRCLTPV